jgi:hypothetical protein
MEITEARVGEILFARKLSTVRQAGTDYHLEDKRWTYTAFAPENIEDAALRAGWYSISDGLIKVLSELLAGGCGVANLSLLVKPNAWMISDPEGWVVAYRENLKAPFTLVAPTLQRSAYLILPEEPLWQT